MNVQFKHGKKDVCPIEARKKKFISFKTQASLITITKNRLSNTYESISFLVEKIELICQRFFLIAFLAFFS